MVSTVVPADPKLLPLAPGMQVDQPKLAVVPPKQGRPGPTAILDSSPPAHSSGRDGAGHPS